MKKQFKSKSLFTLMASLLLFSFSLSACNNSAPNQPNTPSEDSQNKDDEQPVVPDDSTPQTDPDPEPEPQPQEKYYTIVWLNYDNSLLYKDDKVVEGTTPIYKGETPTKPSDEIHNYSFSGWSPTVTPAFYNTTYIAQFNEEYKDFEITWKNYDETVLKVEKYKYGTMPSYSGALPKRESDAQYTYTFNGWSPSITEVTRDATYIAQFTNSLQKYVVTWDVNGKLTYETYDYGSIPTYKKGEPTKSPDTQYMYIFSGWSPNIEQVTGNTTYTAQFASELRTFTVTWKSNNDTLLQETYRYGEMPIYKGATPVKDPTAAYTYIFSGWSPEIVPVTRDAIYTAIYGQEINTYTVTWINSDGSVLEVDENVPYGTTPKYDGEKPTMEKDAQFTYSFSGWSPKIKNVTENVTYTADYSKTINYYTITWNNDDGSLLRTSTFAYGQIPSYSYGTPVSTQIGTETTCFNFEGWSPSIVSVTGNATYTASYKEENIDTRLIYKDINTSKCEVTGYTRVYDGVQRVLTIPILHNSSNVVGIANNVFKNDKNLKGISFPETVTYIGDGAFSGCSSLTSITIPEKVTTIGNNVFKDCSSLTSITIPEGVTSIGDYAFSGCSSLSSITIPDSVTSIGQSAFAGCSSLTSITIPDNITIIKNNLFDGCSSITAFTIPDSVTSIGDYAFSGCSSISSIVIPDSVTSIGRSAFINCQNLSTVTLPFVGGSRTENGTLKYIVGEYSTSTQIKEVIISEGCTSINDYAFSGQSSLTSISIPNSVTSIGREAFSGCSSLASISIPEGVTSIGNYAFSGCSSLISIIIPDSVTSIGSEVFNGCSSLTSITTKEISGKLYVNFPTSVTDVTISEGCTSIGDYAFSSRSSLKSITIPNTVTSIGDYAFRGCSSLSSITIPDSVTSIGDFAFRDCSSLTSITIPSSVTSIGSYAFYGCSSLTSFIIPDSVTSIGDSAFSGCTSLTSFTTKEIDGNLYTNFPSSVTNVTISEGCTSIKDSAFYGRSSLKSITIPNSVTSIGRGALEGCTSLTSLSLPFVVQYLGYLFGASRYEDQSSSVPSSLKEIIILEDSYDIPVYAFSGCSSLESVTILEGVTYIGDNAFRGCSSLTSITIPDGVTSIGQYAFDGCSSLESFKVPNSVIYIREGAFDNCLSLSSFSIGDSSFTTSRNCFDGMEYSQYQNALYIGNETNPYLILVKANDLDIENCEINSNCKVIAGGAFENCTHLKSIVIPNGVTSISGYAFSGCSSLTSISIPDSVTSIGIYAFSGCSSLTSITIPNSVKNGAPGIFQGCTSLTSITIPFVGGSARSEQFLGFLFGCFWTYFDYNPSSQASYIPTSLKEVIITEGCTYIREKAFFGCSSIETVVIPSSVTSIGKSAFEGCTSLTSLTLPFVGGSKTNNQFLVYLFGATSNSEQSSYVPSSLKEVIILEGCDLIYDYAFYGCSSITSITILDGTTYIGSEAFSNCSSLSSVFIPDSVNYIGDGAFYGCSNLKTINIPANISTINCLLFYNCSSLTSITIPNSVYYVGDFAFEGCSSLQFNEYQNALYLGNETNPYLILVKVVDKNVSTCDINPNCKIIMNMAFKNCTNITSVEIPDGVICIGSNAFVGCSALTNVTIPNSVTYIAIAPFAECSNLQYYEYDNALYLGNDTNPYLVLVAVKDKNIENCEINPNCVIISGDAFDSCSHLSSITIPNGVISIGDMAFCECTNLSQIDIPNSVVWIGQFAFDPTSLDSIIIPSSVETLGSLPFEDSNVIIYYCGSKENWTSMMFGDLDTKNNNLVYLYTEIEPSEPGNYWHYVDGVPTVW